MSKKRDEQKLATTGPDKALDANKKKALEMAIAQIEKDHGKGTIMRLNDDAASTQIEVIPTGSLGLDIALGIGGLPKGRIVEIYGPEAGGKTTLALAAIAEAQRLGNICAMIDAEHALDTQYAEAVGVNIDELLVSQPDTGEQALDVCETLVRSGAVDVVVIDSVAALVPKAELEGDMGDALPGLQARLMSQALRKLTGVVGKSKATVIFINQLRMKIGVMFGSPETTTGGNALKFYSSVRLDVRRIETIKGSDQTPVGNRVRVKVVKNKVAPPFRQTEFDLYFGKGVDVVGEIVDIAATHGIVSKAGAWYSYGPERIGQGREAAKAFLANHPELQIEIRQRIMDTIRGGSVNLVESGNGEMDEVSA